MPARIHIPVASVMISRSLHAHPIRDHLESICPHLKRLDHERWEPDFDLEQDVYVANWDDEQPDKTLLVIEDSERYKGRFIAESIALYQRPLIFVWTDDASETYCYSLFHHRLMKLRNPILGHRGHDEATFHLATATRAERLMTFRHSILRAGSIKKSPHLP